MAEEVVEEFISSLEDLTVNSKPLINMLTMLADDNSDISPQIVQAIESRIKKAPSNQKLPSLYLLDSIIKNIQKGNYRQLFAQIIVLTFVEAFEKVDEKTRQAMFKLRQTWGDLFPTHKLYALDIKVHQIDPAWPITAPPPSPEASTSIHVNPKFLKSGQDSASEDESKKDVQRQQEIARQQEVARQQEISRQQEKSQQLELARQMELARQQEIARQQEELFRQQELLRQQQELDRLRLQKEEEERRQREAEEAEMKRKMKEEAEAQMKQELFEKQQELMRLHQQRLELELAEAKAKLEAQQRQILEQEKLAKQIAATATPVSTSTPSQQATTTTTQSAPQSRDPRLRGKGPADPRPQQQQQQQQQQMAVVKPTQAKDARDTPSPAPVSSRTEAKSEVNEGASTSKVATRSRAVKPEPQAKGKGRGNREEEKAKKDPTSSRDNRVSAAATRVNPRSNNSNSRQSEHRRSKSPPRKGLTLRERRDRTLARRNYRRSRASDSEEEEEGRGRKGSSRSDSRSRSRSRSPRPRSPRGVTSSRDKDWNRRHEDNSRTRRKRSVTPPEKQEKARPEKTVTAVKANKDKAKSPSPVKERIKEEGKEGPPATKKMKPSTAAEDDNSLAEKLPDDLAELFGKEDKDYRKLPPIPKLTTKTEAPPASALIPPSPRSASWGQFKADRPEEFPFQMPNERARLQRLSIDTEFRTPLLSPPVSRGPGSGRYTSPGGVAISPEQENLNIPKPLMLSQSEEIIRHADEQVKSGKLTPEKHQELLKQLNELYRLQQMRMELHDDREKSESPNVDQEGQIMPDEYTKPPPPPPGRIPRKALVPCQKDQPPVEAGMERLPPRPLLPREPTWGRERARGLGPRDAGQEPRPKYDSEKYYVPEYDDRWSLRVREKQGRLPGSHSLVINKAQYDMMPDRPKTLTNMSDKIQAVIVSKTNEAVLTVGQHPSKTFIYKLGNVAQNFKYCGRERNIFVLGPLKRFWIDGHQFEVKADSPPLKIWIAGKEHDIRIDSFRKRVFVDGHDLCPFEADEPQKVQIAYQEHEIAFKPPLRQILIDGSLCKLDLGAVFPLVVIKDKPHGIRFNGPPRKMIIDGKELMVNLDRPSFFKLAGVRPRLFAFGGPGHEVIIDDQWYEVKFGGAEKIVQIGLKTMTLQLVGPPPEVKILGELITPDQAKELAPKPPPRRPGPQERGYKGRGPQGPAGPQELPRGPRGPDGPPRMTNPAAVPSLLDMDLDPRPNRKEPDGRFGGPRNFPPRGPDGPRGPCGPPDGRGPHHDHRPMGPDGPRPFMRPEGPRGPRGPRGPEGFRGPMRPNGPQGFDGPPRGPMGPRGPFGPRGPVDGPPRGPMGFQEPPPMAGNVPPVSKPGNLPPASIASNMPPASMAQDRMQGPHMDRPEGELPFLPPPPEPPGMPHPPPAQPASINTQVDVNDLYSKLLSAGIITKTPAAPATAETPVVKEERENSPAPEQPNQPPSQPTQPPPKPAGKTTKDLKVPEPVFMPAAARPKKKEPPAPDVTCFNTDKLKQKYFSSVVELYSGFQCSSCGQRFTPGETEQYSEHLDWHFRQNKREKDQVKVAKYRHWYYTVLDWIQYEEFSSREERAQSQVFEAMLATSSQQPGATGVSFTGLPGQGDILSCPVASGDDTDDVCDICRETFEQFWDEDEEEWHLKDAIRVSGRTYHPVCYEDAKETSQKPESPAEDEGVEEEEEVVPDPITDPVAYIKALSRKAAQAQAAATHTQPDTQPLPSPVKTEGTTPVKVKVESASVEPASVEPASVEPAPVEPAPVEPAPVEPAQEATSTTIEVKMEAQEETVKEDIPMEVKKEESELTKTPVNDEHKGGVSTERASEGAMEGGSKDESTKAKESKQEKSVPHPAMPIIPHRPPNWIKQEWSSTVKPPAPKLKPEPVSEATKYPTPIVIQPLPAQDTEAVSDPQTPVQDEPVRPRTPVMDEPMDTATTGTTEAKAENTVDGGEELEEPGTPLQDEPVF